MQKFIAAASVVMVGSSLVACGGSSPSGRGAVADGGGDSGGAPAMDASPQADAEAGTSMDATLDGQGPVPDASPSDAGPDDDTSVAMDGPPADSGSGADAGDSSTDGAGQPEDVDSSVLVDSATMDSSVPVDSAVDSAWAVDSAAPMETGPTCGFCNTPPATTCTSATTLQFYPPVGTCNAGVCIYPPTITSCPTGCANGACNPSGWHMMNSSTTNALYAMWGSSASDVWAVGASGVAVHYDGNAWTVESPPSAGYLYTISGSGPDDVYTTDNDNVWHFDGAGWTSVPSLVPPPPVNYSGLAVPAPGSLWIAAHPANEVVLYGATGATLSPAETGAATVDAFVEVDSLAVLAISPTDIWVGSSPVMQSNGTTLTPFPGVSAISFWAASPNQIFAGTDTANVEIWNGATWTPSNTGTAEQTGGIWGTSPTRVFVTTYDSDFNSPGEVRAYNGIGWTNETLPATGVHGLYAVYAAPTGEVFAVGDNGVILEGP